MKWEKIQQINNDLLNSYFEELIIQPALQMY